MQIRGNVVFPLMQPGKNVAVDELGTCLHFLAFRDIPIDQRPEGDFADISLSLRISGIFREFCPITSEINHPLSVMRADMIEGGIKPRFMG